MPVGTIASASTTYSTDVPGLAIDGNLSTDWNATDYMGWLQLTFPAPVTMTGIRIAASSSPATSESYNITSSSATIGSGTGSVGTSATILATFPVTPGAYSSITINVNGMLSWVVINEVSIITSACP